MERIREPRRDEFRKRDKNDRTSPAFRRKVFMFGFLVVLFGFAWMMKNFGVLPPVAEQAIFSWQALVIGIGLINLVNGNGKFFGAILILVGGFFMATEFFNLPFEFRKAFWPTLVIIGGLALIFGSRKIMRRRVIKGDKDSDDFIEEVAIFGGGERKVVSSKFKGGEIVSIFGGSVIDLTASELNPDKTAVIEMVNIFGGSKVIVPEDWNVKTEFVNVFGGFADKRNTKTIDEEKLIILKGVAIFGGGELANI